MADNFFGVKKYQKCDVTLTYFNKNNFIVAQRSITFDIKPTIKELKNRYAIKDATLLRITTTPSYNVKTIKI